MWLWYTETFATQIRQVAERLCWPHSNADVSLSDFLEEMPLWHMDSEATASWRKAPLWIILIFTTPQICKNIILDHNDLLFCGSCLHFLKRLEVHSMWPSITESLVFQLGQKKAITEHRTCSIESYTWCVLSQWKPMNWSKKGLSLSRWWNGPS